MTDLSTQMLVYNDHKRMHTLKFHCLNLSNGMIGHLYGPVGRWNSKKHIKCTAHHHPPLFKDHRSTVLSPRFLPGPDFFGIMQSSNIRNLCPMYRTTHLTPIQQNHTALHLLRFKPLLHFNCSVHSRPFVCSSYVPFCYPSHPEFYVPPCRSFRLSAKSACLHCRQPALANSFKLLSPPHLCFGTSPSPSQFIVPSPPSILQEYCVWNKI